MMLVGLIGLLATPVEAQTLPAPQVGGMRLKLRKAYGALMSHVMTSRVRRAPLAPVAKRFLLRHIKQIRADGMQHNTFDLGYKMVGAVGRHEQQVYILRSWNTKALDFVLLREDRLGKKKVVFTGLTRNVTLVDVHRSGQANRLWAIEHGVGTTRQYRLNMTPTSMQFTTAKQLLERGGIGTEQVLGRVGLIDRPDSRAANRTPRARGALP